MASTETQLFETALDTAPSNLSGWTWATDLGGGIAQVKAENPVEGTRALKVNGTGVKQAAYVKTPPASFATYWSSQYCYLTAAPNNNFCLMLFGGDAFFVWHQVGITTDRRLYAIATAWNYNFTSDPGASNGNTNQSAANVVPLNEIFRIDTLVTATTATIELFTAAGSGGIHSTGPAHYSASATNTAFTSLSALYYGPQSYDTTALRTFLASGQSLHIDRMILSDVSRPAPIATLGTPFHGVIPI